MAQIERHRSPRQAAKALIVAGAVGALALAGISGALAQRDDMYDDSPSSASGIFGDDFPGGAVFPSGVFGDDRASDVLSGGDINVGGGSGGTIMVGGNSGGGISIGGGSGMSGGGGGSGNGAGGGGTHSGGGYGR